MFTIRIHKVGCKVEHLVTSTTVETLAEAEIVAINLCRKEFASLRLDLVYIDELDYYAYYEDTRIARITINPVYKKARTK